MGFFGGWRGLGRFWGLVAGCLLVMVVVLQSLGPPSVPHQLVRAEPPPTAINSPAAPRPVVTPPPASKPAAEAPDRPGRDSPGPVAAADPAMLEVVPGTKGEAMIPRVAPDGRKAMQFYAAGFDRTTMRARVGLLMVGLGMNEADSLYAVRNLPAAVTLGLSPYGAHLDRIATAARMAGHEFVLSIPMEPAAFPLNDPGPQALMTSLPPETNQERLYWALSRVAGYVGVTNALGPMRGERFSGLADQMHAVLKDIDNRGLVFVDARPGSVSPIPGWGRAVDILIDDPPTADSIDDRLEALSKLARDKGAALGLAMVPRQLTVDRIAAWTNGLTNRGLALAPVTAIVAPATELGSNK